MTINERRNLATSQQLQTTSLKNIVEMFGFPDDEREVLGKKVFIWNKAGRIVNVGDEDIVVSQGNCRLKVVVDNNENVESASISGIPCRKVRKQVKKYFKN